jgi:hypothetical protein
MVHLCKSALLVSLLLGVPSVANASFITIDPNDYPFGTDLSTMFEGATLSKITNRPNTDGMDGKTTFQPIASAAYAVPSYHLLDGLAIGSQGISIDDYESCRSASLYGGSSWACGSYDVLDVSFQEPTNIIQVDGAFFSDGPQLLAYDPAGNRITFAAGELSASYAPISDWSTGFSFSIHRQQSDIARVVFGGRDGNATASKITYNKVPAPSTLLMLSVGALFLLRVRKRT